MNRVERHACESGVLGQSVQDLALLAEHRLTSTWEVFCTSEMGTFGEPKLRDFATIRALAMFM